MYRFPIIFKHNISHIIAAGGAGCYTHLRQRKEDLSPFFQHKIKCKLYNKPTTSCVIQCCSRSRVVEGASLTKLLQTNYYAACIDRGICETVVAPVSCINNQCHQCQTSVLHTWRQKQEMILGTKRARQT